MLELADFYPTRDRLSSLVNEHNPNDSLVLLARTEFQSKIREAKRSGYHEALAEFQHKQEQNRKPVKESVQSFIEQYYTTLEGDHRAMKKRLEFYRNLYDMMQTLSMPMELRDFSTTTVIEWYRMSRDAFVRVVTDDHYRAHCKQLLERERESVSNQSFTNQEE